MFEYLLVFSIPKGGFYNKAVSLNMRIQEQSVLERDKRYYPHLTALLTCLNESKEGQFIRFLRDVTDTISPFNVSLSDIKGFDYNSVIYVDIEEKKPIKANVEKLKAKLNGLVKPYKSVKYNRTFEPRFMKDDLHITIEKHLEKALYDYFLPILKSENHTFENFRIDQMVLFKKRLGPYKNQKIAIFKFLGKSVGEYIQGSLFNQ